MLDFLRKILPKPSKKNPFHTLELEFGLFESSFFWEDMEEILSSHPSIHTLILCYKLFKDEEFPSKKDTPQLEHIQHLSLVSCDLSEAKLGNQFLERILHKNIQTLDLRDVSMWHKLK